MPTNLIDGPNAQNRSEDSVCSESGARLDRRRRRRTPVRWRVALMRRDGLPTIETITQNLSSTGFYCLSPLPLTPGEILHCTLRMPHYGPHEQEQQTALECRAVVVRAEAAADDVFGIGCRIEDYHFLGNAS